ncbi:hypothetical protein GGS24DRAFT_501640 [Hypoxylon argillaceum]|nr:hypothetical protein GGS24DRAFT_501640 [Hypoxylon argillaceum]KAI1155771.1 hypothetical protein F4825DRAFT_447252 [Nemania diffusa]
MIARHTRQMITAPLRIPLSPTPLVLVRSRAAAAAAGAQHLPRARFSSAHDPQPEGSLNKRKKKKKQRSERQEDMNWLTSLFSPRQQHKTFYKTFGRPIAKAFLIAVFTYQLAYYFWVKLEQDEMRAEMEATISDLETRIDELERTSP